MTFSLSLPNARPAVIGLGYVGLPLAVAFGRLRPTVGFDIDADRVIALARGTDATGEVSATEMGEAEHLRFESEVEALADCNVYVVAVPTPVNKHKWPDLTPLIAASRTVGSVLKAGDVVIFESTVYPGATDEVCVPALEQASGLKINEGFYVGYSPERINPGDKTRRLADVVKVTSGSTPEVASFVDALYREIVPAGTHLAPSIRVAEASKAIENTQRDVNIALMNEFAQMFSRLDIDTEAVLRAAGTKWNFLPFTPGLVGGHCIGVDPYYLVHKAQEVGYHAELVLAARRLNEGMSQHVTSEVLKLMARKGVNVVGSRVLVLGVTFKEDCADLRNTRVIEIVRALESYHATVDVHDPWANAAECLQEYQLALVDKPSFGAYDCVIVAVAHKQFRELGAQGIRAHCRAGGVVYDIKYVLPREESDGRL